MANETKTIKELYRLSVKIDRAEKKLVTDKAEYAKLLNVVKKADKAPDVQ